MFRKHNVIVGDSSTGGIVCSTALKDVDVDFLNPFLLAVHETFLSLGNYPAVKGELTLTGIDRFNDDIMIVLIVDGGLKGTVVLSMDEATSKKFVSSFLMGLPVSIVDSMALNSLKEFSIRISEKARIHLGKMGHTTNLKHEVMFKQLVSVGRLAPFLTLSLNTKYGPVKVFFNIQKSRTMH